MVSSCGSLCYMEMYLICPGGRGRPTIWQEGELEGIDGVSCQWLYSSWPCFLSLATILSEEPYDMKCQMHPSSTQNWSSVTFRNGDQSRESWAHFFVHLSRSMERSKEVAICNLGKRKPTCHPHLSWGYSPYGILCYKPITVFFIWKNSEICLLATTNNLSPSAKTVRF